MIIIIILVNIYIALTMLYHYHRYFTNGDSLNCIRNLALIVATRHDLEKAVKGGVQYRLERSCFGFQQSCWVCWAVYKLSMGHYM